MIDRDNQLSTVPSAMADVVRLLHCVLELWRGYFRVPDSLRYLQKPSSLEESDSSYRLTINEEFDSSYRSIINEESDSELASNRFQNGGVYKQEDAKYIEELQGQLQRSYEAQIGRLEDQLKEGNSNSSRRIEELRKQSLGECTRYKAEIAELENKIQQVNASLSGRIEELQNELEGERSRYEERIAEFQDELKEANDNNSCRIEELYNSSRKIEELQMQLEGEHHRYAVEIQNLVNQLELAERQNSRDFAGGESFLDSGATPHLLNKAVTRVNQTSGNFTRLLMLALKNGGIDCTKVAEALVPCVPFERAAHTKYAYQALVCKVLFTDFESECFNIEDNALDSLDPEQHLEENFQRYQHLIKQENPEELVYEDATDSDFRRFCNKKQKDLIAALSLTGAPGVGDVGALVFGEAFGPDGIRRGDSAVTQAQTQTASTSFVKFALAVFLVHKLAFSMHPLARIFRVKDAVEFLPAYMEPVVESADSDDEVDTDPGSLIVGFMVVPGFTVRKIVVHSRVYTVKRVYTA